MCPTSYAVDYTIDTDIFSVDVSRPTVDNNHAYVEVLQRVYVEEWSTYGYFTTVYAFSSKAFTDSNREESIDTVDPMLTLNVDKKGTLTFNSYGDTSIYYVGLLSEYRADTSAYYYNNGYNRFTFSIPTGYEIVGFHAYGFDDVTWTLSSFQEFTVLYDDEASTFHKLSELYLLISSFEPYFDINNDYLLSILNSSLSIDSKLSQIISYYAEIKPLLVSIDDNIDVIRVTVAGIEGLLSSILAYVEDIDLVCWFINGELQAVNSNLLEILNALNLEGESNLTSPDTSNNDKYYDMEQSLLDNSGVDVNNAVQVEIDQNALVVIWDMVEDLYNTHPQVFGLVITVLSLSIIALILGRGKS